MVVAQEGIRFHREDEGEDLVLGCFLDEMTTTNSERDRPVRYTRHTETQVKDLSSLGCQ